MEVVNPERRTDTKAVMESVEEENVVQIHWNGTVITVADQIILRMIVERLKWNRQIILWTL